MSETTASGAVGPGASIFYATEEPHPDNGTLLGFWIYLMSDCLIFAVLFACYAVYGGSYAGGPTPGEVFDLHGLALNTAMLLFSSITYGFAMLEMAQRRRTRTLAWLAVAGLFAVAFVGFEVNEFAHMIAEGAGPWRSAFLSSFFALVATHGLHVTSGIIWLATLMIQVGRYGLTAENERRLSCLSMFWHFLDLVWVGVFSFVYLVGVLR
ncbi:cytochrome o ubiquinol oxidase subunit III [Arhodomonas aquaeolei]|uniref:cytochrome o ubiquinol oxidase subunit III n=1 Tax=Arhodomonas aquaeolei TaxID=2369 RepID=UPI0003650552|nr:cytochrome o ubiquinol oxidase subunit III [Arhodomonas aquaeolei]MCS4505539.1 cytochrome o ubiquinol oxidase subunit III [Arhodomonas aquaeolei]